MKKIILGLTILVSSVFSLPVTAATQDFYFDNFTADYYLSKDSEGRSHLKVKEQLTAVFPDYKQNKGICRQIPYLNQNGANVTLKSLNSDNVEVLRNGEPESIYSIEKYNGHYEVCTGTDEYVLGRQIYTFEYEFENVVTDFDEFQELYWDTNGNGWSQKFNSLIARVHFASDVKDDYAGKQWCYVGAFGQSGQTRCTISETADGLMFVTNNLVKGENLTFDIQLNPGSFVVPPPVDNYILVWVMIALLLVCVLLLCLFPGRKFTKVVPKIRQYKAIFVAPQYQPSSDYSLSEMSELYLKKKKNYKVGILLDLVVRHKIEIRKNETSKWSKKWEIVVKDVEGLRQEEKYVLELLNGGSTVSNGDTIVIQNHAGSTGLRNLGKKFDDGILADLKRDGLVEKKYKMGDSGTNDSIWMLILEFALSIPFMLFGVIMVVGGVEYVVEYARGIGGRIIGVECFLPVAIVIICGTLFAWIIMGRKTRKYLNHTTKGLEMSKYMEGLKMYIEMAEAERLKFLQSVDGADVSATGIVKLYEKLLPYAAVFGLEESWMKEMEQYCEVQEIEKPDYLMSGLSAYELSRTMRSVGGYANTAASYSGSSVSGGGGWSSGSSGGGGGGSSGGGGGGGGGGGR